MYLLYICENVNIFGQAVSSEFREDEQVICLAIYGAFCLQNVCTQFLGFSIKGTSAIK